MDQLRRPRLVSLAIGDPNHRYNDRKGRVRPQRPEYLGSRVLPSPNVGQ